MLYSWYSHTDPMIILALYCWLSHTDTMIIFVLYSWYLHTGCPQFYARCAAGASARCHCASYLTHCSIELVGPGAGAGAVGGGGCSGRAKALYGRLLMIGRPRRSRPQPAAAVRTIGGEERRPFLTLLGEGDGRYPPPSLNSIVDNTWLACRLFAHSGSANPHQRL